MDSLDTIANDSTVIAKTAPLFIDKIQDQTSTEFAFWISVGLLIIVSILKYVVSHEDKLKDWAKLIVEIPIDLCLVLLTILVTIYLNRNLGGAMMFIVVTIFTLLICCVTRRKSIDYMDASDSKGMSIFFGFLTVTIAVILCTFVYNAII